VGCGIEKTESDDKKMHRNICNLACRMFKVNIFHGKLMMWAIRVRPAPSVAVKVLTIPTHSISA